MEKNKIFISHASKDSPVVAAFVEHILRLGLDIPSDLIFCSSMEGHGVKSGEYIPDILKEEIQRSSVAILFISKNYKASEVCLNEMGAAWVTLQKSDVIPLLLPDINFDEIGFLNVNRLGLKIEDESNLYKLVDDMTKSLQPYSTFSKERLHKHVKIFIEQAKFQTRGDAGEVLTSACDEEQKKRHICFDLTLLPFDRVLRKSLPTLRDGIHEINNRDVRTRVLRELSETDFLDRIWFRDSTGDIYIRGLYQLSSGNWLIESTGDELDIVNMWISMSSAYQFEFILIKAGAQEPYKIDSDVGGTGYEVGILPDGTIVSSNERINGYAIINGTTVDLNAKGVDSRQRHREPSWIFLVSDYHKIGYNYNEAMKFCKNIDNREIEITKENLMAFLGSLPSHPTVETWR